MCEPADGYDGLCAAMNFANFSASEKEVGLSKRITSMTA